MTHAERMERFHGTDLYVVITESYCGNRPALEVLDAVLQAGVGIVQLREKALEDKELFERACAFRAHTHAANALLIIDDRIDIALAADADGVHLGEYDLPVEAGRGIAEDLIIGASSHNLEEALAAQAAGASYVNIGPIFHTQTKAVPTGPIGLDMIESIRPHLQIPFTNMGGIKLENVREIVRRGGRHPAVVTAVTQAANPAEEARALREAIAEEIRELEAHA